jgi:hypothetical protein
MINSKTQQGSIYFHGTNGQLFNGCAYIEIGQILGTLYAKMIAQVDLINGVIRMSLTDETISKFSLDESDTARINSELSDVADKVNDGSIEEDSNHTTWDFYESSDCTQDRYSVTDVEYTANKILQANLGNSSTPPPGLMSTAMGIHNQSASQNLKNNLGNPFSKIDDILGQDTEKKTTERDDAIDKVRDVANTGLKIGRTSRGELAEVVLKLYSLDDLCYSIPGTRVVMVERKKANNRVGSNEFYVVEEIIENTEVYLVLSNSDDEATPRKILYSDMRQDSMNGTAMLKHEALEVGDLMDIHLLKVEQKPISKLMSLFEDEPKEEEIEVNDTHLDKLNSLFGDDDETETHEEEKEEEQHEENESSVNKIDELLAGIEEKAEEKETHEEEVKEEPKISYAAQMIAESMNTMNADKIAELKERIAEKQKDIKKYQYEAKLAEQRAKQSETDLEVLYSRLGQMEPKKPANGYGFAVGVMNEENASMEVLIIRAADSYTQDDFKNTVIPEDVKKELAELGLEIASAGLGESTWKQPGIDAETIEKLKNGARISLKGMYKAYHELKLDLTKAGFVHDANLELYIDKKKEELCASIQTGSSEMDNEIRQSIGLFDAVNEVAPMGMGGNTQVGPNTVMPFGNPYTTNPVNVNPNSNGMQINQQGTQTVKTDDGSLEVAVGSYSNIADLINSSPELQKAWNDDQGGMISIEDFMDDSDKEDIELAILIDLGFNQATGKNNITVTNTTDSDWRNHRVIVTTTNQYFNKTKTVATEDANKYSHITDSTKLETNSDYTTVITNDYSDVEVSENFDVRVQLLNKIKSNSEFTNGITEDNISNFVYELQELKGWPQIDQFDGNEWSGAENLDLENYEIVEVSKNRVSISCGGDWQSPALVHIGCDEKGNPIVYNAEYQEYTDGMSDSDIVDAFSISNIRDQKITDISKN